MHANFDEEHPATNLKSMTFGSKVMAQIVIFMFLVTDL